MSDQNPTEQAQDAELTSALEAAWPAAEPPDDLADSVLATFAAEQALTQAHTPQSMTPRQITPPGRSRWTPWIAAAAAALITWGLHHLPLGPGGSTEQPAGGPAHGAIAAAALTEVQMGHRARATAQPGAALSWRVADAGDASVQQTEGRVFYRVDPGAPFTVQTPAGAVTVRGTCFEIELVESDEMSNPKRGWIKHLYSGAAGAALGMAALVTVYEGQVEVSQAGATTLVSAGEQAAVAEGRAPITLNPATRDSLAAEVETLEAQKDTLTRQVDRLEADLKATLKARDQAPDAPPATEEMARLKGQVKALEEALDAELAVREEREGKSFAFPEDLPPAFTADALRDAFEADLRTLGIDGSIESVDCSEFPCIVYGEAHTEGEGREELDRLFSELDRLQRSRFNVEDTQFNGSVWGKSEQDDQGHTIQRNYFGYAPSPKGFFSEEEYKAIQKRLRFRNQQHMEARAR